jgi:hypothetical protein
VEAVHFVEKVKVCNGRILEGTASGMGHLRPDKMPLSVLKDAIVQKRIFAAFVSLTFDLIFSIGRGSFGFVH